MFGQPLIGVFMLPFLVGPISQVLLILSDPTSVQEAQTTSQPHAWNHELLLRGRVRVEAASKLLSLRL